MKMSFPVVSLLAAHFNTGARAANRSASQFGTQESNLRRSSARTASVALAAVLLILSACALLGALFSYRAGMATTYATEVSSAFEQARYWVGAEESLERKYRLEPSPEIRSRHRLAGAAMLAALDMVRSRGADIALVEEVSAKHQSYLSSIDRMFAAIDIGDGHLADQIDGSEVDPSFGAIEEQVVAAADRHRTDAAQHLTDLAGIQKKVLVVTAIVFVPGIALVVFFSSLVRGYRRQADAGLLLETAAMRRSEQRLRALVQNTSDAVLICSADGVITYQSSAAETIWGYDHNGLLDQPMRQFVHLDDVPALLKVWEQLLIAPGTTRSTELQIRDGGGTWRHADLILTNLLDDASVQGFVATVRDISERKAFEQQLTRQAFYDALTGLPNRVLFRDRFDQALARAERRNGSVGLLFLDLDNFKQVNDSLGHQIGDRLLTEVAARLRDCVHEETTIARLGGDEFVILLEHLGGDADAVLIADRVSQRFSQPFRLAGRDVTVSASIGISVGSSGHEVADNMLRDADVAMYHAKGSGKARCVVFNASMQTDALARLVLENELRRAIAEAELRVHYQPIVMLEGGHVTEVEALVRWQHPTRGLVPPADFIPIAEDTGLIVQLGQWVLEEACRQTAIWQRQYPKNPPLMVSVNLSSRQFMEPALLEDVKRALDKSGLDPTSLKLEITESVIMRDVETTIATLWHLKDLGIQLAIDDFGTGYSSLSYLKRLPFDVVKIDRSFVNGIGQNQEDRAIVRAVISMAQSLNLSITAEGIETVEQSDLLRSWSCERGQGYHYARPLDAPGLEVYLRNTQLGFATDAGVSDVQRCVA